MKAVGPIRLAIAGGQAEARTQLIGALHQAAGDTEIDIENLAPKARAVFAVPGTVDCLIVLADGEAGADDLERMLERLPVSTGLVLLLHEPYALGQIPDEILVLESRNLSPSLLLRAARQAMYLRRPGTLQAGQQAPLGAPAHDTFDELAAFTKALRQAHELPQVFAGIDAVCRRALGASSVAVALPGGLHGQVELAYVAGVADAALELWDPAPREPATPLSDALLEGELVALDSPEAAHERYSDLDWQVQPQLQSVMCAPFPVGDMQAGAIGVGFGQRHEVSEAERQFLDVICQQVGDAITRLWLVKTADQASRAARIALHDREVFLATAAHELRTPLTLILGQAQLMQRRLAPGDVQSERSLESIVGQAQRLSRLMTSMVSVFQLEDGSLELKQLLVDLGDLVTSVVHEAQRIFESQQIVLVPPPRPLLILGDPMYLEQIVHQILQSAVRYSSPRSEIVVKLQASDKRAVLMVRDPGSGVPVAQMADLFQRFSRAHDQAATHRRGLGIGLYLVREVIERHGGEVTVESIPEHGSQFSVSLPLVQLEQA